MLKRIICATTTRDGARISLIEQGYPNSSMSCREYGVDYDGVWWVGKGAQGFEDTKAIFNLYVNDVSVVAPNVEFIKRQRRSIN